MCADSTCPCYLAVSGSGQLAGGVRGKEILELLLQLCNPQPFRSYSDFTCAQPMDSDCLVCLAWLANCPSRCNTRGPPSLLHQAVIFLPKFAQPGQVPRRQTSWPTVLSGLHCPSDTSHTTTRQRLGLFCFTTSAVITKTYIFTHSIFHSLASRPSAKLCSFTGPNTI